MASSSQAQPTVAAPKKKRAKASAVTYYCPRCQAQYPRPRGAGVCPVRAVNGTLPLNVKFLVEGEEEVGGASIAEYVAAHSDKLRADVALVSDTAMYAEGMPTLCIGLRGLVYMEVEASGPSRDLHSGLYGGAAPNPVFGLIELLSKAKSRDGRILFENFLNLASQH